MKLKDKSRKTKVLGSLEVESVRPPRWSGAERNGRWLGNWSWFLVNITLKFSIYLYSLIIKIEKFRVSKSLCVRHGDTEALSFHGGRCICSVFVVSGHEKFNGFCSMDAAGNCK